MCHWGVYEVASALSKNDIVDFFRLPSDSLVIDGYLQGDDLDTGIEALEIDVGVSGDTDKFLNSGVLSGDAVTEHVPLASIRAHFTGTKDGPVDLAGAAGDKTLVFGTVVAAATSGGTGTLFCYAEYTSPMATE